MDITVKYKANWNWRDIRLDWWLKGYLDLGNRLLGNFFSHSKKLNTILVLISLEANHAWSLQKFDIKNACLHGDPEAEVYMETPTGFDKYFKGNGNAKIDNHIHDGL